MKKTINFYKFLRISTSFFFLFLLSTLYLLLATSVVEAKSIVMRILVVNPSKERAQTVPIKTYLPQEIRSEDVIDPADFKLDYDVQRGLYYIFKDVELKPAESVSYAIELRDVWIFPEEELNSLKEQADDLAGKLTETDYSEQAVRLKQRIESKIEEILRKQEGAEAIDVLPQKHIAAYRENVETLEFVKADLIALEKLLIHGGVGAGAGVGQVSIKTTWKIILAIVLFLGVLSVLFFVVWHMQAKQQKGEEGNG